MADSRAAMTVGDLLILVAGAALLVGLMRVPGHSAYGPRPDFADLPIATKKQEFFDYLTPMIEDVNARLMRDLDRLVALRIAYESGQEPDWFDRRWLTQLAERLDVPLIEIETDAAFELLERRTGIVPLSLVLAQAALESGWGTSRFALEGNNYFGQRCYELNCGLAPLDGGGVNFGLARFESAAASVESYIMNLNTHPEYFDFRVHRQALRDAGALISGLSLVNELAAYSERGIEYVDEVRSLIRANDLE